MHRRLVEREAEIARVDAVLTRLTTGTGTVLILDGVAGIGT